MSENLGSASARQSRLVRTQLFADFFLWEAPRAVAVPDTAAAGTIGLLDQSHRWGRPVFLSLDPQRFAEIPGVEPDVFDGVRFIWAPLDEFVVLSDGRGAVFGCLVITRAVPRPLTLTFSVHVRLARGRWAFVVVGPSERRVASGSALAAAIVMYYEMVVQLEPSQTP